MPMRFATDAPGGDFPASADVPEQTPRPAYAPTILVTDDDAGVLTAMAAVLRRRGYGVVTARDGLEAVERLKDTHVNALVLDLHMAGHDGFETLTYVRDHRRGLPLVLVTGLGPDDIERLMRRTKVDALPPLFTKPCDPDQVLGVLELMLAGTLPPAPLRL